MGEYRSLDITFCSNRRCQKIKLVKEINVTLFYQLSRITALRILKIPSIARRKGGIIMLKRCRNCGLMFETKKGNRILCDDCKNHKVVNKPKVKQHVSITEMTAIIEKHNQKYGTSYTYGEFCDLVRQKKIIIRNGGSFERGLPQSASLTAPSKKEPFK